MAEDSNKTTDEQEKKNLKRQKIRFARNDERKPRRERPRPEGK